MSRAPFRFSRKPRRSFAGMLHRHPRIWLLLLLVVLLLGIGLTYLLTAISTVEQVRNPEDPVTVYLLDYGYTASLAIPLGNSGDYVRYAYGDWKWYALGETTFLQGAAALLWPTQAGLGREVHHPQPGQSMEELFRRNSTRLYVLTAPRADVERTRQRLDRLFESNRHTLTASPYGNMEFVHHPRAYTALWNSNHFIVSILREMNLTVHGQTFASRWRVEPAAPRSR